MRRLNRSLDFYSFELHCTVNSWQEIEHLEVNFCKYLYVANGSCLQADQRFPAINGRKNLNRSHIKML